MGMQPNVAAGLSYVFGWITGLIFFFMEKQNRYVRFHAMQSIIFFGGLTVLITVLEFFLVFFGRILFPHPHPSPVLVVVAVIVGLLTDVILVLLMNVGFVLWIVLLINGFQGSYFKLPLIGSYAERFASRDPL